MKWLLSMLGITSEKNEQQQPSFSDTSFFMVTQGQDQLICEWKLRSESKLMIQRDFKSRLFIRIRDTSGDKSISSKSIEVSLDRTKASIDLPSASGRILVDLGYKCGLDFITLEYQLLDFGPKKITSPAYTNWFANESPNIHEEMYKLALKGGQVGGSEFAQKN